MEAGARGPIPSAGGEAFSSLCIRLAVRRPFLERRRKRFRASMRKMTLEFWAIVAVGVAVLTSRFSLHRDMASLRERMAKLEGAMDGFTKGMRQVGNGA